MKKQNAFTLIELLAVIVILAIIAVIATPLTINVINNAKQKSFINSVYGLIDGVRLLSAEQLFQDGSNEVTINFTDGTADNANFKVSGDLPNSGSIYMNSEGKIALKVWSEELRRCAEKSFSSAEVMITNTSKEDCKIMSVTEAQTFTEVMTDNPDVAALDPDQNLRYVGTDPSNYVWFNNELWRVIGVFDGQAKIIKDGYYNDGNTLAFDKGEADGGTHGSWGYNDWAQATLQTELNETYLSSIQTNDPASYSYIDLDHVWNIAGYSGDSTSFTLVRSEFYHSERSETISSVMSSHLWTGAIGLMYASDYGYSTSLTTCDDKGLYYDWPSTSCPRNSWLYDSKSWQWTLTPHVLGSSGEFVIVADGRTNSYSPRALGKVKPTLYLKENVKIIKGTGDYDSPYILSSEDIDQELILVGLPTKTDHPENKVIIDVDVITPIGKVLSSVEYKVNGGEAQPVNNNQIILDEEGEYIVEVIATDSEGNIKTFKSGIYQIDTTAPTITFEEGDTGITIDGVEVPDYDLKSGVSVTDNYSISLDNVTNNNLEQVAGEYEITYTATDIAGNVTTKIRKFTITCTSATIMGKTVSCQTMANDPDGNHRFVGKDPNNYVLFNKELWRIIGIFDGQAKIIRNNIYDQLQWDSNNSNNWATASLKVLLNEGETSYLKTIETNDSTSYSYIDLEHVWNIGAAYRSSDTRSEFYNAERSETTAATSGSEATWTGAIGLMSPSDYGYTSIGDATTCDSTGMYSWYYGTGKTECAQKSWLHGENQWTLTPHSSKSNNVFSLFNGTGIDYMYTSNNSGIKPTLYLKSNVIIIGGQGTHDQPYQLGTN